MPVSSDEPKRIEPLRGQDFTTTAFCIERDFRGLVETLKRTIAQVDPSDEKLLENFVNTKAVAQRGLRLSKLLLRETRKRRA